MKVESKEGKETDPFLVRRLERKKELNNLVYVKPSSSAADIEKGVATSKPTNQDDSTDQDEVPMLFKRLNSPRDLLDKTRDEVTAAAGALQEMFWHQDASAATTEQRDAPESKKWTPSIASARDLYASSIASCAPMSTSDAQGIFQSPFTCSDFSKFDVPTLTCIDPSSFVTDAKQVKPKAATTETENNKQEELPDEDVTRDKAEGDHNNVADNITEQRDEPEAKKWTPIASARDLNVSSIASCAQMPTSDAQEGMFHSPLTCSDFSKFDVPTLTCVDPSTLISEAKQVKPKALATSMESAILTQIDATERSIFGVIAPKDTARLDAMERKLATLKKDSTFDRTDTLSTFPRTDTLSSFPRTDTFRRADTFTFAESPTSTFDSIDVAPSKEDDNSFNRSRSQATVIFDEVELELEEPTIPASERKPATNERKPKKNPTNAKKTNGWFKKKGKAKSVPSKKKEQEVIYDITRMASF